MELDFEALGIELDDEQKKKLQEAVTTAHESDVAGLKAKRDELLSSQSKLKDQIKQFEGIDPERVRSLEKMLSENEEAKLIADGKIDELVNKRLSREQATWQSQIEQKDSELDQYKQRVESLEGATIDSGISSAGHKVGLAPTAVEDAQVIARHSGWKVEEGTPVLRDKEGNVVRGKSGPISLDEWLETQREARPHWFPTPKGGGAAGNRGGGQHGNNPWKKETFNLSRQGQIHRDNPELADRLKAEAGTN